MGVPGRSIGGAAVGIAARRANKIAERAAEARQLTHAPSPLSLPPIPDGHIRLTHATSPEVRNILEGGDVFMARHGIGATTDSYSSNADIEYLAATGDPMGVTHSGQPSRWSRNSFGNQIVLLDLPAAEHKAIHQFPAFTDPLPNHAIVGFIDRDSSSFAPNPRYDMEATRRFSAEAAARIRALQEERRAMSPGAARRINEGPAEPSIPTLAPGDPDAW